MVLRRPVFFSVELLYVGYIFRNLDGISIKFLYTNVFDV